MRFALISILGAFTGFSAFAAPIYSISCKSAERPNATVLKLTAAKGNRNLYNFEVSLALDGRAFTSRAPLALISKRGNVLNFGQVAVPDGEIFVLDANTLKGWATIVEEESIPFSFDVANCKIN